MRSHDGLCSFVGEPVCDAHSDDVFASWPGLLWIESGMVARAVPVP